MLPVPAELRYTFDNLAIAANPAYLQLFSGGKLHCTVTSSAQCDVVDDYSCRLICECLTHQTSLLIVWPDTLKRRGPIALAAGLIYEATIANGRNDVRSARVLHVGQDTSIRHQLDSVRVGAQPLSGVFVQEFLRKSGTTVSLGPESSLPIVTIVAAPANPVQVINEYHPKWITVDCDDADLPKWLPGLLAEAKRLAIPVIGWSSAHLAQNHRIWKEHGSAIFRWPKSQTSLNRFPTLEKLDQSRGLTEIIPVVIASRAAAQVATLFTECYFRLAKYNGRHLAQLSRDGIAIAWRYLRLLESVPVSIALYDAECANYWGMPRFSQLQSTLFKFVESMDSRSSVCLDLKHVLDCLRRVQSIFEAGESPLWEATADALFNANGPSHFAFANKAYCDLFRFSLLSKMNVTDKDLRDSQKSLGTIADRTQLQFLSGDISWTVVGLPGRSGDIRLEHLLSRASLKMILWPHLEEALRRRVIEWSGRFSGGHEGPLPIYFRTRRLAHHPPRVRLGTSEKISVQTESHIEGIGNQRPAELWAPLSAADAISALFKSQQSNDHDQQNLDDTERLSESDPHSPIRASDTWIERAVCISFHNHNDITLPCDDFVNVIVHTNLGVQLESRSVQSLRIRDEILLVDGEHRRDLYQLAVSRIHSHNTVTVWLDPIAKWHDELHSAYVRSRNEKGITFDDLLAAIQRKGSRITSAAAVRNWIIGVTTAPNDVEDIRRIGEVLDLEFARDYAFAIGQAASRLAGLHRSLSLKLNRLLEDEASDITLGPEEETFIDESLGLTIDDFRHSIVRARVKAIVTRTGPFLISPTGYVRGAAS